MSCEIWRAPVVHQQCLLMQGSQEGHYQEGQELTDSRAAQTLWPAHSAHGRETNLLWPGLTLATRLARPADSSWLLQALPLFPYMLPLASHGSSP